MKDLATLFYEACIQNFPTSQAKQEAPWSMLRQAGQQAFMQQGLPTKKSEKYRYTPLHLLMQACMQTQPKTSQGSPLVGRQLAGYHVVIHDQYVISPSHLPQGLSIGRF